MLWSVDIFLLQNKTSNRIRSRPPLHSIPLLLLGRRHAAAKLGRLQANRLPDELVETVQITAAAARRMVQRSFLGGTLLFGRLRRLPARLRAALRVRQPIGGLCGLRGAVPGGKRFGRLAQAQALGVVAHVRLLDVEDGAQILREGGNEAQPRHESCLANGKYVYKLRISRQIAEYFLRQKTKRDSIAAINHGTFATGSLNIKIDTRNTRNCRQHRNWAAFFLFPLACHKERSRDNVRKERRKNTTFVPIARKNFRRPLHWLLVR